MRVHGKSLLDTGPTARTILGRRRRTQRFHSLPGACWLVREDRTAVTPPGVVNALVETGFAAGPIVLIGAVLSLLRRGTAAQVGRLDRFHVDHVVLTDQRERAGVMKVGALAPHMLMLFGEQLHRLLAAAAALLPFGYPLLRFLHLALGCAGVPGMLNELPVRRDAEHLQPHVDAGRFASEGQWLRGHLCTPGAHR